MIKNTFFSLVRGNKGRQSALTTVPKRFYERMSTEDYLINIRKSMTNPHVQKGKLPAILEASMTN